MRQFAALIAFVVIGLALALELRSVRAGTAEKLDFDALFRRADWVVHGRVLAKRVDLDPKSRPETEYTLALDDVFWGKPANPCVFRVPGGVLANGSGLVLPGVPTLDLGEELVLFLSVESSTGQRMPIGLAQGKYTVVRDAKGPKALLRGASDLKLLDRSSGITSELADESKLDWVAATAKLRELARARKASEAKSTNGGK